MKRLFLVMAATLGFFFSMAGQTITLTTDAEPGTKIRYLPNTTSATRPLSVDYGDGVIQKFVVNPMQSDWERWIEAEVKGPVMTFSGNLTSFELRNARITSVTVDGMQYLTNLSLRDNEITSFELLSETPLEKLDLYNNRLINKPSENPTLTLEKAGSTLRDLNLSHNAGLQCLDMRDLVALEYLSAYSCPEFGSLYICAPEERHEKLRSVHVYDCSLAHFYPVNLPALTSLDLSNNALLTEGDEPFPTSLYPNLRYLTLTGNRGIKTIDISANPLMEQLYVNDCSLTNIDVSMCPELNTLHIGGNNIKSINLSGNPELANLYAQGNPISEIDMSVIPKIEELYISGTNISRIDLMKSPFIERFNASNTPLEFVDFNGLQPDHVRLVDLRNCPNFTYESMAYTLATLPMAYTTMSQAISLYLEGSNAEKSNISYLTSPEMGWICDITGNNTARHSQLKISYKDAAFTGEKKQGRLERLYPIFAASLDYDLNMMHTAGGDFVVAQWEPEYFYTIKDATDGTVLKGVPICVYTYPEPGKRFRSVTVNGKEIFSPWFIVSENAEVAVNFDGGESSITLTVEPNHEMSFRVNTVIDGASVAVDWGNGVRYDYPGQAAYRRNGHDLVSASRIDGTSRGNTVTIYGDLAGLDINGYGEFGLEWGLWDNQVKAIDVSNAPNLKILTTYWNPIKELDLSNNPLLEVLDISYNAIENIDLSNCASLVSLLAYSSGNDYDEGIKALNAIDLSKNPLLEELDIKNNGFGSVDLSKNTFLRSLNLVGNKLTTVDLSNNPRLQVLNLMSNELSQLDLAKQTVLEELNIGYNNLNELDLSNNTALRSLSVSNNNIKQFDLHALSRLESLYINGNGMTADQLNDVFYLLPQCAIDFDKIDSSWNLCLYQGSDKEANDYKGSDGSLAYARGWIPSHFGSNSGSEVAYLDYMPAENGTFTVTDANGNTYFHGSKVEKWLPLTIKPVPADGYKFHGFRLNDEPEETGDTFEMPGIYTQLYVVFDRDNSVATVENGSIAIEGTRGGIAVTTAAEARVEIYTPDGRLAAAETVNGTAHINLAAGIYIVKAAAADASLAKRIQVK